MTRVHQSLIAAAAVAATWLPFSAHATVQCKPSPLATMALTQSAAEDAWRALANNTYGAAWADFGIAANKQYYDTNLGVATMTQVSAVPCAQVASNPIILKRAQLLPRKFVYRP
jgi:hypothetical protein